MKTLQWGRILLSALLAAIIALGLTYATLWLLGRNPGGILDGLCPPDLVEHPDTGNILQDFLQYLIAFSITCLIKGMVTFALVGLLIYFPLAIVVSILLTRWMVQQQRLAHTILAAITSIPIALGLLLLVAYIMQD